MLAKQAASLDRVSGGRLVLGVGLGNREEDFRASGLRMEGRGAAFDRQLARLKAIWAGEELGHAGAIGPAASRPGGPQLLVGGYVAASLRRAARYGDGWIMGGRHPSEFADFAEALDGEWQRAGREGEPRKVALVYYALGPGAERRAHAYLTEYYSLNPAYAEGVASRAATSVATLREYAAILAGSGCDEVICIPCLSELAQVERLVDALGTVVGG